MDNFLRSLVYVLPILVGGFIVRYLFRKKENNNPVSEDNSQTKVLKIPFSYRIIPFVVSIMILVSFTVIGIIQGIEENWPAIIIACIMAFPCLIMAVLWSLWKVEIREEDFVYRNWFGKKRTYRYEDLELRYHPKGLKWYFYKDNKKVFCMAYYIDGGEILERRYKKMHKKAKNNLFD